MPIVSRRSRHASARTGTRRPGRASSRQSRFPALNATVVERPSAVSHGCLEHIPTMNVVIVELPAKAKTINKYLGRDYKVVASYGHVRDLPAKDGSVLPDEDFAMSWEVDGKSEKHMKAIAEAMRGADRLFLATDPDREGEAISWHVREVLRARRALKDVDVKRVVFNEVTKQRGARRVPAAARDRPRAGRGLSGAPGARLSGRLHAVAGAVAQIAGQPLGGPRAIGRAASGLRARSRDRGVQGARILDHRGRVQDRGRRPLHRAADPSRRQGLDRFDLDNEAKARAAARRDPEARRLHGRRDRAASRSAATRSRRSRPRPCSRRRRASSASAPAARCRSRSSSTRVSSSAARRSA